jgi:hypothetical protein
MTLKDILLRGFFLIKEVIHQHDHLTNDDHDVHCNYVQHVVTVSTLVVDWY